MDPDHTPSNDEETEASKSRPSTPVDENPTPLQKLPSHSPLGSVSPKIEWSETHTNDTPFITGHEQLHTVVEQGQ
jgi:hypothetical protein